MFNINKIRNRRGGGLIRPMLLYLIHSAYGSPGGPHEMRWRAILSLRALSLTYMVCYFVYDFFIKIKNHRRFLMFSVMNEQNEK